MATAAVALVLLMTGCGGEGSPASSGATDGAGAEYPEIVAAELTAEDDETWTLEVTVSSPYDSPDRYADGWRVLDPDGEVLGTHELTHDHAGEQPFTRTQTGLRIPEDIQQVTVEGRDLDNGYGGETVTVEVPPR